MKAITLIPSNGTLRLADRPEPQISQADEVKLRVIDVGICRTDREEVARGRGEPPPGQTEFVLGHEMLGQVVEAGAAASAWHQSDFAVVSVRRPCDHCPPCSLGRSDMCTSGDYVERGIERADGFNAEYVVDRQEFLVRVPPDITPFAVLTEPMSVAEKAIDEASRVQQARLPLPPGESFSLADKNVLVAGLGTVGLLTATLLALRGAKVRGLDVVEAKNRRVSVLTTLGGEYIEAKDGAQEQRLGGQFDLVFEATGIAHVEFDLLKCLAPNGLYVALGIPSGERLLELDGAAIFRHLVLGNQGLLGSVNAALDHFRLAVADLCAAEERWPGTLACLITTRRPYTDFASVFEERSPEEIKTVLAWSTG